MNSLSSPTSTSPPGSSPASSSPACTAPPGPPGPAANPAETPAAARPTPNPPSSLEPSLWDLGAVVLEGAHREIHRVVAAGAGGPEPWRRRKLSEAHDLLALAQVSGRVEILSLDLRQNFRAMLALRVPVPCRRGGVGPFTVAPTAVLGLQYRPEAMVAAQPGTSFIEILEPRDVFHSNVAPAHEPPGAQLLCLGHLPAGVRVSELVLLAYSALSLQTVQFSLVDPMGLLHPAAAIFFQNNGAKIPLTREPFLKPKEATL